MKPVARREPLILSADAPESWADWEDGRVTCGSCRNRSRDRCIALKTWAHLPMLKHYCESHSPERGR